MLSSWRMVHNLINRAYIRMPPQGPNSVQVGGPWRCCEGRVPQEGRRACTSHTACLCTSATWLSLSCTL